MIGDGDHVEAAGLPVEIDQLAQRQAAVAPCGVGVEVAQQVRFVSRHVRPHIQCSGPSGRWWTISDQKFRT